MDDEIRRLHARIDDIEQRLQTLTQHHGVTARIVITGIFMLAGLAVAKWVWG